MPKFTVKEPLNHDGKDRKIDSVIELADDTAAPLLACNPPVIEAVALEKAGGKSKGE